MRHTWIFALILLLAGNIALGQDESMLAGFPPEPEDDLTSELVINNIIHAMSH